MLHGRRRERPFRAAHGHSGARQCNRRAGASTPGDGGFDKGQDFSYAVDMAGHEMTTETLAERNRLLEVDAAAGTLEPGRDAARFRGYVGAKATRRELGNGEAHTLHANRVAHRDVGPIERRTLDFERRHTHDGSYRLDDPREHAGSVAQKRGLTANDPADARGARLRGRARAPR